jgi:ATP-binding cassette subfamily B protein
MNNLASPHANRDTQTSAVAGRGRGPRTVTAAEKAQARDVSLRRIGRLFSPYRWQLAVVTAIIAASSIVGLASPFLLRAVIDTALPTKNVRLLVWLVIAMVAVAGISAAFGVIQTWISTKVGQQVMHGLRTGVFAHLQRQSVAFFTKTPPRSPWSPSRGGSPSSRWWSCRRPST